MAHGLGCGMLLASAADLDADSGFIKLTGSTASLSATTYPDLFDAIGYNVGGAGDSFDIPSEPTSLTGSFWYIAAFDPEV